MFLKKENYSSMVGRLHAELHRDKPDVSFSVDGKLMGKQRPRSFSIGKQTRMYTPKETVSYEKHVANCFKEKCSPLKENTALFIEIVIHHEYVGKVKVKREKMENLEIVPAKQPDVDNILKIIMDGLEKVAYQRDSQIIGSLAYKKYAVNPFVKVYIWEL